MRQFRVLVNGNEYMVAIEELEEDGDEAVAAAPRKPVQAPAPASAAPRTSAAKQHSVAAAVGNIVAALPGTILSINVDIGDAVKRGQSLLVLEAMKMENDIMAPSDGVVKEIVAVKGASGNSGDLLMVLA